MIEGPHGEIVTRPLTEIPDYGLSDNPDFDSEFAAAAWVCNHVLFHQKELLTDKDKRRLTKAGSDLAEKIYSYFDTDNSGSGNPKRHLEITVPELAGFQGFPVPKLFITKSSIVVTLPGDYSHNENSATIWRSAEFLASLEQRKSA